MKTVGSLFSPVPTRWGLRGDPFLWKDLSRVFRPVPLPDSADTLNAMLEAAFFALTAQPIGTMEDMFYVKRYAHGGMSSGHIDPNFWRDLGFPLILERFIAQPDAPRDTPQPARHRSFK